MALDSRFSKGSALNGLETWPSLCQPGFVVIPAKKVMRVTPIEVYYSIEIAIRLILGSEECQSACPTTTTFSTTSSTTSTTSTTTSTTSTTTSTTSTSSTATTTVKPISSCDNAEWTEWSSCQKPSYNICSQLSVLKCFTGR